MTMAASEGASPLETIREETREEHERTERAVEGRFFAGPGGEDSGAIDRAGYRTLLEAFLGLYRPLDDALAPAARRHLDSFEYRRRAGRLVRDLHALGRSDEEIGRLPQLPSGEIPGLDGPRRLMGCLYVVEGSELGGRVIWKRLRGSLDDEALRADAFFGREPEPVRRRWNRFRAAFERRVAPGPPLEEAVEAALSTFRMYRRWMS